MKKIVFLCPGDSFPKGAFSFVKEMQEREPVFLTGAFFHTMSYGHLLSAALDTGTRSILQRTANNEKAVRESIKTFEHLCGQGGIKYNVHLESPLWNEDDVVKESRFADLLVASEELFFKDVYADQPNGFLKRVLHDAECPVLLVPEDYRSLKSIIITYDGKRESMFALKEFCTLFPYLTGLPAEIADLKKEGRESSPDLVFLKDYAGHHFENLDTQVHFDAKKYLAGLEKKQKDVLVISGPYSRTRFSITLRENFLEKVISDHRFLLFIAPAF